MKRVYQISIFIAIAIVYYLYAVIFNEMAEEDLIFSLMFWYIPLTFGLYGLAAYKVKELSENNKTSALKLVFSGKDVSLTIIGVVILFVTGFIGVFLFVLPLSIIKVKSKAYHVYVALLGSVIWLVVMGAFFVVLWDSL